MSLDMDSARRWLYGHEEAQRIAERERRAYLTRLGADEALRLYLSLLACPGGELERDRPSPVLVAMRDILRRKGTEVR